MGIRESLRELREKEKLSVKREVKKELTKLKKDRLKGKKCAACKLENARYFLKGSNEGYCRACAIEYFGELAYLKK